MQRLVSIGSSAAEVMARNSGDEDDDAAVTHNPQPQPQPPELNKDSNLKPNRKGNNTNTQSLI